MIKVGTIGMIDKNAKSFPTVKAHADITNGYVCSVASGATVAPVAGASGAVQTKDLYLVMNTIVGDNAYIDGQTIASGDYVNAYLLKQWDKQTLVFDEGHITYASEKSYSDIVAGTTKLVAGTDGKFAVATDVTYYGVYFEVTKKVQFNGNAVEVRIVVA